jgi:tol-pal system protein YbgF
MGTRVSSASAAVLGAALVCAATVPACARSAEERQLDEMRATIDQVQAERDEAERDMMAASAAETQAPRAPRRSAPSPPALPVGGSGTTPDATGQASEGDSPDTEDPTPRPTIRVVGSAHAGRGGWRDDQVERSDVETSVDAERPSALDPEAKRAYSAALALVSERQYDRALEDLAAFLVKYPDHPYADNAMYWRGECYFAKGDYLRAAEQFEGTVTRFPAGNKAPDALLKMGMSHLKLGNPAKAKECFDRLAQTYPRSDAARRIPPVTTRSALPRGSEDQR